LRGQRSKGERRKKLAAPVGQQKKGGRKIKGATTG